MRDLIKFVEIGMISNKFWGVFENLCPIFSEIVRNLGSRSYDLVLKR